MKLHPWSDYIIWKGFLLSCALLAAALLLSVWASAVPAAFPMLRRYVSCYRSSAGIVLAAALLGGLLLEDLLRGQGL